MYRLFKIYLATYGLIICINHLASAQESAGSFVAVFHGIEEQYVPNSRMFDSLSLLLACKEVVGRLRQDGYWLASTDKIAYSDDTTEVWFYQGRMFEQVEVSLIRDADVLGRWPKFWKSESQQLYSLNDVGLEIESALKHMEANGYPFATLTVDSSRIDHDVLKLSLKMDPGIKITYDSISVSPGGLVKTSFLSKYLELDYGKNYDEEDLNQVKTKIQHLPFLSLEKMSTSFQLKKARVHLDVAKQKVNYFNGLLGLVPGQDGSGAEVTGELDLAVNNLFSTGKKVVVNWQRLEPGAQQLHASYLHPILLGSPLDFYFALDQVRQDTLFSNRSLQVAFDYRPADQWQIRMSYENLLGNKLEDQQGETGDFDINYYGLSLTWLKLDRLLNPKRGFKSKWISNIGSKAIRNDQSIPESTQYRFQTHLEWFKPIGKRSVLYLGQQNGIIFNDYLYLNDLYRLGGLRSIRGFNELEFFASKYAVLNIEWRYYLDDQSYLVTFYDQSILAYEILSGSFDDKPAGVGIGMEFTTGDGNFKILYGLGKRDGQPFSFTTSKIHFGYTAIF